MKLWIDDIRPAPTGYVWCKTVNEAKLIIECVRRMHCIHCTDNLPDITLLDMDHDAGEYACSGGDYVKLLDWMETEGVCYPIRIHSMNPVGVENTGLISIVKSSVSSLTFS